MLLAPRLNRALFSLRFSAAAGEQSLASHAGVFRGGMKNAFFSVGRDEKRVFSVGRDEKQAPLKTPAWKAKPSLRREWSTRYARRTRLLSLFCSLKGEKYRRLHYRLHIADK